MFRQRESVQRERKREKKRERKREREKEREKGRDGKSVQREGRSVF